MCTVTFFPKSEGSWILSTNRDERKSREKALPPQLHLTDAVSWLGPVDPAGGGTWIGLNTARLCLTLVNNYQGHNPALTHNRRAISRGLIIPGLMHLENLSDVDREMDRLDVTKYNPFRLFGIQTWPYKLMIWSWNGEEYVKDSLPVRPHIWVSAGGDFDGILRNRRKVFEDFLRNHPDPEVTDIRLLHASEYPEKGAHSISMELEQVGTVSNTIAEVKNGDLKMHYHDGRPVKDGHWEEIQMSLPVT